jgi:hypothetical protein
MTPNDSKKWEDILVDIEKKRIPPEFIKKVIFRLSGKKQHTINVASLIKQGLVPEEVEELIARKIHELDEVLVSFEIILNTDAIAGKIQPETDRMLNHTAK